MREVTFPSVVCCLRYGLGSPRAGRARTCLPPRLSRSPRGPSAPLEVRYTVHGTVSVRLRYVQPGRRPQRRPGAFFSHRHEIIDPSILHRSTSLLNLKPYGKRSRAARTRRRSAPSGVHVALRGADGSSGVERGATGGVRPSGGGGCLAVANEPPSPLPPPGPDRSAIAIRAQLQ